MEKSKQKKILDNLTVFVRYVSSVCCSVFFSSTFLFLKYIEYKKIDPSTLVYLICILPTMLNYLIKMILSLLEKNLEIKDSYVPILSLLCGLILVFFIYFENYVLKNSILFGILVFSLFNTVNTIYFFTHERILNTINEKNFNSFKNRITKIIKEEIPTYCLAYYISVYKKKGFKPYFLLVSFVFLTNTLIIGLYNLNFNETQPKTKPEQKIPKIKPKIIITTIFILKVLGEFNETYLYSSLAGKLKENGHLIYFFSVQFLFKLGYRKIENCNLLKFTVIKILLYISSLLVGSSLCLLNRRLLSLILFTINGVTNQIVFATFDYLIDDNFLINLGELLIFLLITSYVLFYKLIHNNDSLEDIIFMSNVRL